MIDLAAIAEKAIATGWNVADSITLDAIYKQVRTPSYNAATGAVTPDFATAAVKPIFTNFDAREKEDANVRQGDKRILIRASEMGSITPTLNDQIVETGGTTWNVLRFTLEATKRLYIFHGRRETA